MKRGKLRLRIAEDGGLEVVDPGFDTIRLMRAVDPSFRVHWQPLPYFVSPRIHRTRESGCGLDQAELARVPEDELWSIHRRASLSFHSPNLPGRSQGEASLLDLKTELSRRLLTACRLCHHRCGVDRLRGETGKCGLGPSATVNDHFVHIAEESPVNPSLVLGLTGCGLRCHFCQQGENLQPRSDAEPMDSTLWDRLDLKGARSLSFVGGNPDESLHGILCFLAALPRNWRLPIVWNSHGYGTVQTVEILDGIVDAYIPDFKFGNDACGHALADAPDYPRAARQAIAAMTAQGVPVMVRILVLPGHGACCHLPVLEWLAGLPRENLFVSLLGRYGPDWKITARDGKLAQRVSPEERESVREAALNLGLRLISE